MYVWPWHTFDWNIFQETSSVESTAAAGHDALNTKFTIIDGRGSVQVSKRFNVWHMAHGPWPVA